MMDYREAILRIYDHQQVHKLKEQPRCQKITEALSLAIDALESMDASNGIKAQCEGVPIQVFTPTANETIVIRFDPDKHSLDFVKSMFEHISGCFPRNTVAILPDTMALERMDKVELAQFRDHITQLLERFE